MLWLNITALNTRNLLQSPCWTPVHLSDSPHPVTVRLWCCWGISPITFLKVISQVFSCIHENLGPSFPNHSLQDDDTEQLSCCSRPFSASWPLSLKQTQRPSCPQALPLFRLNHYYVHLPLKDSGETGESLSGEGFSKQIGFESEIWLLLDPGISTPFDAFEIPKISAVPLFPFLLQRNYGQSLLPSRASCCLFSPLRLALLMLEGSLPFYCLFFFPNIF